MKLPEVNGLKTIFSKSNQNRDYEMFDSNQNYSIFLVISIGTILAKESNAHMVWNVFTRIYILVNKISGPLA